MLFSFWIYFMKNRKSYLCSDLKKKCHNNVTSLRCTFLVFLDCQIWYQNRTINNLIWFSKKQLIQNVLSVFMWWLVYYIVFDKKKQVFDGCSFFLVTNVFQHSTCQKSETKCFEATIRNMRTKFSKRIFGKPWKKPQMQVE